MLTPKIMQINLLHLVKFSIFYPNYLVFLINLMQKVYNEG